MGDGVVRHEYEAPDFADLARQHGASWAGQLTEDELRKAMRIEVHDYADEPNPNLPPPDWAWRVYFVICAALFVAVLVIVGRL
jgi:hypothetical protein